MLLEWVPSMATSAKFGFAINDGVCADSENGRVSGATASVSIELLLVIDDAASDRSKLVDLAIESLSQASEVPKIRRDNHINREVPSCGSGLSAAWAGPLCSPWCTTNSWCVWDL